MPCFYPSAARFAVENVDGVQKLQLLHYWGQHPPESFNPEACDRDIKDILLPCGQCIGCRLEYARQWSIRIQLESKLYKNNLFCTLTYNEISNELNAVRQNGNIVYTLRKEHLQLFMKRFRERLREKYNWTGVRFFAAGEYGDRFQRPHFHVILFNLPSDMPMNFYNLSESKEPLYIVPDIEDSWGYGFAPCGEVTFESAAYVARYATKKITGKKAPEHYGKRIPEFTQMSRRPGIAASYVDTDRKLLDAFAKNYVIIQRSKSAMQTKPPRYWSRKLQERFPDIHFELSEAQRQQAVAYQKNAIQQSGLNNIQYWVNKYENLIAKFTNQYKR